MEGFSRKMKKAAIYGAVVLGMVKGNDMLNQRENQDAKNKSVEVTTPNAYEKLREATGDYLKDKISLNFLDNTIINSEDGSIIDPDNLVMIKSAEKEWLLGYMKSSQYQQKALAEGLTQRQINQRISRLEGTPIYEHDVETLKGGEHGHMMPEYNVANFKDFPIVNMAKKQSPESLSSSTVHELEHAATLGDKYLSSKARQLYLESFTPGIYENSTMVVNGQSYGEYLKNLTERDARKRQLEYEAEKMGIMKIGQVVTEKEYKKIMDVYNSGKFTYGARQFIETTKPEYFLRIMNEVAENGSEDTAPDNLPIENQA